MPLLQQLSTKTIVLAPLHSPTQFLASAIDSSTSSSSYFATDGQSASPSWCWAPIWSPWPDFITVEHLWSSCCGMSSLMRRVCNLLVQFSVTLQAKSRRAHICCLIWDYRAPFFRLLRLAGLQWRYSLTKGLSPAGLKTVFYCPNSWDSPNLEALVLVFISPRNKVAQINPRALGSLSVASYDSQGYNLGILSRLHTGWLSTQTPRYMASAQTTQKTSQAKFLHCREDDCCSDYLTITVVWWVIT
jgi:hypothetical protein